jgi:hypothetical protein
VREVLLVFVVALFVTELLDTELLVVELLVVELFVVELFVTELLTVLLLVTLVFVVEFVLALLEDGELGLLVELHDAGLKSLTACQSRMCRLLGHGATMCGWLLPGP